MLVWLATQVDTSGFDMNTGVSVAVFIVVIGSIWRLSAILQEIRGDLGKLKSLPLRLRHIENHLIASEEDLNNLWVVARAGPEGLKFLAETRRGRFKPVAEDDEG